MKRIYIGLLVALSLFLSGCISPLPAKLQEMLNSSEKVKKYESFEDINPLTPLPAQLNLGLGTVAKILLTGKQSIPFAIVTPSNYNDTERSVLTFFSHPGLQKSLRLVSYARQLKQDHPFRINPFIPFFTLRTQNNMLAKEKVGPAALITPLLQQEGPYQGTLHWGDYSGNKYTFDVAMSPSTLPRSGTMLLFDHQLFSLSSLLENPEKNVLQDVIIHEFTHIWNSEIISPASHADATIASKKADVGHDTMIVSTPELAFTEGLAEAFEAIYGDTASQLANMTKEERKQFYGGLKAEIQKDLEFLINRQIYIRENSYLYNLYDFKNCTLRLVKTIDSSEDGTSEGGAISIDEALEKIKRGENVDMSKLQIALKRIDFENFKERFYAPENRVFPLTLRQNCEIDSPGRLESKEGYVASLLFGLMTSGALAGDDYVKPLKGKPSPAPKQPLTQEELDGEKTARLNLFKTFANKTMEPVNPMIAHLPSSTGRQIAGQSNQERMKVLVHDFLLGFRNLVLGISKGEATTIGKLLSYYFSSDSFFNRDEQIRLAFYTMLWTEGTFFKDTHSEMDLRFKNDFKDRTTVKKDLDFVFAYLDTLYQTKELPRVIGRMGDAPGIYVEYPSHMRTSSKRRININLAHHIDLIDIFGTNNKQILALANKLDRGEYFSSESEFLDFARSIGSEDKARTMLDTARKSILENEKLRKNFVFEGFRTSAIGF